MLVTGESGYGETEAAFPIQPFEDRAERYGPEGDRVLKRSRVRGLILSLLGLLVLLNSLGKPRVEALHGADILGLIASGMCCGVAFVGLMGWLKVQSE
jgi:hypothetical protein